MGTMPRTLPKPVSGLALWSGRLASLAALIAALGVYLVRSRIVAIEPALAVLASGFSLSALAITLALAGFIAIWRSGARGLASAYTGFALALGLLAYPAYLGVESLILPAITDVSTDPVDAPAFSPARQTIAKRDGVAPPPYHTSFAAAQKRAYPDIQPIVVQSSVEETFRIVMLALQPLRWTITEQAPPQRARDEVSIEAVDRSSLLRIPEDIVIRIRPYRQETRIDLRSVSRIGAHDFGSNARRITRLTETIAELAREK